MTGDEEISALLLAGHAIRAVARTTGASYHRVRRCALRLGRPLSRGHPAAPSHPWKGLVPPTEER